MLEEAVSSVCGAAQAVGVQVGGEMEEGGEALVPATDRRKVSLMSLFSEQAIAKEKTVRAHEMGKEDAQVLMRGADHRRGHNVRCGESMVCLEADFRDEPKASDDAEEAH